MTFEQQKNTKAFLWTTGIHILLIILFLTLKYNTYTSAPLNDFNLELVANLGTSDNGLGIDQPELMEDPAPPEDATNAGDNSNPAEGQEVATNDGQQETDDNIEASESETAVPVLHKSAGTITKNTSSTPTTRKTTSKTASKNNTKTTKNTTTTGKTGTATNPKYVFAGGTGKGGNSATQNKPGGNEGIGTGDGDMGTPGGSPNGLSYSGGVSGRKIVAQPGNKAEFRNGGKVRIKVWVDRSGNITRYTILSAANSAIRAIADQKIKGVRFNKEPNAPVEQNGIIVINFRAGSGK